MKKGNKSTNSKANKNINLIIAAFSLILCINYYVTVMYLIKFINSYLLTVILLLFFKKIVKDYVEIGRKHIHDFRKGILKNY